MDYNDIKSRIERTFIALNARLDDDIEKHTHYHFYTRGKEQRVTITYGTEDEKEVMVPIMNIIHNLATLKDHLKNSLKTKGLDPQIVETAIDDSLHLQVLIDIDNQDKHGTSLRNSRSKKSPVIKNAKRGLFMGSKVRDIEGNIIKEDGPSIMAIKALIKDDKDELLFNLDDLIEVCYSKWISIIKNYKLAELIK